ncbi:nuclear transport factor 2 family protein [Rhodococcus qingshengii]|uniref:nuclear transport factor 2 family protein n=1 Tax=Rhodococcus qingshengii TaxID=334542 RepID=UPI00237C7450|nr:nuclear transport factor 2 family protein [Rhodococcus qingshengii]WCT05756.1 nuclear transport factor 2 family protein [Rhodococcus qingshengii]
MNAEANGLQVTSDERAAALETVYSFHRHIDRGEATRAISLVADDADFTVRGERMRGRTAVENFLTWREAQVDRKTVHVIESSIVTRSGPAEFAVDSILLMHSRDAGGALELAQAFEITHTLIAYEGNWLIRDRSMTPIHR